MAALFRLETEAAAIFAQTEKLGYLLPKQSPVTKRAIPPNMTTHSAKKTRSVATTSSTAERTTDVTTGSKYHRVSKRTRSWMLLKWDMLAWGLELERTMSSAS